MDRPTRPADCAGVEYVGDEEKAEQAMDRIDARRGDPADGGGDQGGEGAERAEGCTDGRAAAGQRAVVVGASTDGSGLRGAGRPRLTEDAERLVLARYYFKGIFLRQQVPVETVLLRQQLKQPPQCAALWRNLPGPTGLRFQGLRSSTRPAVSPQPRHLIPGRLLSLRTCRV